MVVEYAYDAWGKVLSVTGTLANTIGALNPFRYRDYYYDTETGFYYCISRYYDPEICRWINADGVISGVGSDVKGYNVFAYCFNNPVNLQDETGNWPRWITKAVAVVATAVAVVAVATGNIAVAAVAVKVAAVATVTYVAQSLHYDKRKAKNTSLPKTPQEADDLNWKNSNPKSDVNPNGGGPAANCHQYTSPDKSNVKFVSPDGHREVIYNSEGNIVLDSRDIGTYNFCPSDELWYSNASIGHFIHDILPWILFGNDDDDLGPVGHMIISILE
jgi:RHS repeat-associated protein